MMKFYSIIFFLLISVGPVALMAQDTLFLELQDVIQMAQGRTARTTLAQTRLTNRYWTFKAFEGSFKPFLHAEANLPDFNRAIAQINQPDGSVTFTPQSYLRSTAGLRVSQIIPSLGTQVDIFSGLERLDILDDLTSVSKSYFSTPISIGFTQPLFAYNPHKWSRKIQPLIYEEAQRQYIEDMEFIAFDAVNAFFNFYNAQLDYQAARLDKQNADSMLVLSQGRYEVGQIAETDLMQIELNVKSAESNQAQAKIDMENFAEDLRQLLNLHNEVSFHLNTPEELDNVPIDIDRALQLAHHHRPNATAFHRRLLEAEQRVDQANQNAGLSIRLSGRFGLSQTDETLSGSFQNLLDQERLSLSLQIPIADWGRSRADREIAASNLELTRINVEQEKQQFEREIDIKIREFQLLREQVHLAKSTFELAQKRLDITRKRYFIGKIDVLNLNQAIIEKENSRKSYFSSLQLYYLGYYRIRLLTLFDFKQNSQIEYEN